MCRFLLALGIFLTLPVSASATSDDPPADVCLDLERLAAEFEEALQCLSRDDSLRTEVQQFTADLRFLAIRCANRDCDGAAARLSAWATQLDAAGTSRTALRAIHDQMVFRLGMLRLRRTAALLLHQQHQLTRDIRHAKDEAHPAYDQGRTEPTIGEPPLIVVSPNTTFKVRHTLGWRQYPDDTLTVELVSSSAEVVVPGMIKLDFEKHSLDFEYEIRVGAAGDYSIRLIPAVGQPVLVSISVK